jgi:hypothetical protein
MSLLQLFQLQPGTHLTASTSSPPRPKASRTHAATLPRPPRTRWQRQRPTQHLCDRRYFPPTPRRGRRRYVTPIDTYIASLCVFLFLFLPTLVAVGTFPDGISFGWHISSTTFRAMVITLRSSRRWVYSEQSRRCEKMDLLQGQRSGALHKGRG